jgi:hypothetical protein
MIAGEFEGLYKYDSYNRTETKPTNSGRSGSESPKPNERQQKLDNILNKGKEFVDKQGGIEGLKETYKNYKGYIKDDTPSDYEIEFGKAMDENKKDKDKEGGIPSMVIYVGIGVAVVVFAYALYSTTRPATV